MAGENRNRAVYKEGWMGGSLPPDSDAELQRIGQSLRHAREAAGHSLTEVSVVTRIHKEQLRALEEGRMDALPGQTFVVGFLRLYANYLQLPADELVAQYQKAVGRPDGPFFYPAPTSTESRPTWPLVVGGMVVLLLLFMGYHFYRQQIGLAPLTLPFLQSEGEGGGGPVLPPESPPSEGPLPGDVSATPSTLPAAGGLPGMGVAPPSGPGSRIAPTLAPTATGLLPGPGAGSPLGGLTPAGGGGVLEEVKPVVEETGPEGAPGDHSPPTSGPPPAPTALPLARGSLPPPAPENAAPTPPPVVPELPVNAALTPFATTTPEGEGADGASAPVKEGVLLIAEQDVWVMIRDKQGNVFRETVLRRGNTLHLEAAEAEGLSASVGNAGGLKIEVDGRAVPPLGTPGQVLRGVSLAPKSLRQRLATP